MMPARLGCVTPAGLNRSALAAGKPAGKRRERERTRLALPVDRRKRQVGAPRVRRGHDVEADAVRVSLEGGPWDIEAPGQRLFDVLGRALAIRPGAQGAQAGRPVPADVDHTAPVRHQLTLGDGERRKLETSSARHRGTDVPRYGRADRARRRVGCLSDCRERQDGDRDQQQCDFVHPLPPGIGGAKGFVTLDEIALDGHGLGLTFIITLNVKFCNKY